MDIVNKYLNEAKVQISFLKGRFNKTALGAEEWEKKVFNVIYEFRETSLPVPRSWKPKEHTIYDFSFTQNNELMIEISINFAGLFDGLDPKEGERIFLSLESHLNKVSKSAKGAYKPGQMALIKCVYIGETLF